MTRTVPVRSRRRAFAVLAAALAALIAVPAPALALTEGDRTSIDKTASVATVEPGDGFFYTIQVQCTDQDDPCLNAVVTDLVPEEFTVDAPVPPASTSVGVTGDAAAGAAVTVVEQDGRDLVTVAFALPLGGGSTQTITIPVHVRDDLPQSADGVPVTNSATIAVDDAQTISDTADVTPIVPLVLEAGAGKTVTPESATANPGTSTFVNLTGVNASNGGVDRIVVTDPSNLDPAFLGSTSNPFHYLSPSGGATIAEMPSGADQVVLSFLIGGVWTDGPPSSGGTVSGPTVADPTTVQAIRLVFSDSEGGTLPAGATGRVQLSVAQNDAVEGLEGDYLLQNTVAVTVEAGEEESDPAPATAPYFIGSGSLAALAQKSFSPSAVTAGQPTLMTLRGTNSSAETVNRLILVDRLVEGQTDDPAGNVSMFADGVDVEGWGSGIAWPPGAQYADITFEFYPAGGDPVADAYTIGPAGNDGTNTSDPYVTDVPNTLPAMPVPNSPTDILIGFGVGFTGAMGPGAAAVVPVSLGTPIDGGSHADADDETPGTQWRNVLQLTTQITDPEDPLVGSTGVASDTETLTTYEPQLAVEVEKRITPSAILGVAGNGVVVQLETSVAGYPAGPEELEGSSTIGAETIVVQDPVGTPDGTDEWWAAFGATRIVHTAVPTNATLLVEYWSLDEGDWATLTTAAGGTTLNYSIPAGIQPDVAGLRFTYTATGGTLFQPGATVQPNYIATLRESVDEETTVENLFSGTVSNDGLSDTGTDGDEVELIPTEGDGTGDLVDKEFVAIPATAEDPDQLSQSEDLDTITARSADRIDVRLAWSTGGYQYLDEVWVTDVADPETTDVEDGFYDAFDLVAVPAITTGTLSSMDPLLRYDRVLRVELWNSVDEEWQTAANDPCPSACDGAFPGLLLTDGERETTTGVRLVLAESPNRGARIGTNPALPQVGTGVAASIEHDRRILLRFELRDVRRSDGSVPVLGTGLPEPDGSFYNLPDAGMVLDDARVTGYAVDGETRSQVVTGTDDDVITILDTPLDVGLEKEWQGGPIGVPPQSLAQEFWPSGRVVLTATNETAARVDQLAVTDPILAPGDPDFCMDAAVTDPFEVFDLLGFVSISVPEGADPDQTAITLTGATPSSYSGAGAIAAVLALEPEELADVTAISVDFGGRIESGASTQIVFDLRLRTHERSSGDELSALGSICNVAQAVVSDAGSNTADAEPLAQDRDFVALGEVGIGLETGKSFRQPVTSGDPASGAPLAAIVEPSRGPATVVLTGQPDCHRDEDSGDCDGYSRATLMSLTDDEPLFWNQYELDELNPILLQAPVDQVRVDALVGGTFSLVGGVPVLAGAHWEEGGYSDGNSPQLPTDVEPEEVQGLRFVFSRVDGGVWENPQYPVETATFDVLRRELLQVGEGGALDQPVPSDMPGNDPAPGESAPGVASNVVDGYVEGADTVDTGAGPVPVWAADSDDAELLYRHATNAVEVGKFFGDPQSGLTDVSLPPGSVFTYSIQVTNSGDVPIVDPVVVDAMPTDGGGAPVLQFDPAADPEGPGPYSYALEGAAPDPASGPAMPTDAEDVEVDVQLDGAGNIVSLGFSFPEGTVLEVGQSYTIAVTVAMRPGLAEGEYRNTVGVTAERPWDECNGDGRDPATDEACEAVADFTVTPAAALRSQKYVAADLVDGPDLGVFSTRPAVVCEDPVASGLVAGFWAPPCVPRTAPGQTEYWRMLFTNTGNVAQDRIVAYDVLPQPGDHGALNMTARQSQWRPVLAEAPELIGAPAGAQLTVHYLTDATPGCTGNLITACPGSLWTLLEEDEDDPALLASIRALRFTIEFDEGALLLGAGQFAIGMTTTTPAVAPSLGTDLIAYNTVASVGYPVSGSPTLAAEGYRVGVALASGELEVLKEVEGDMAGAVPDGFAFEITVSCTSLGEEVPLGEDGVLTLLPGVPTTITGIPYGSICNVVEDEEAALPTEFTATEDVVIEVLETDPELLDGAEPAAILGVNRYDEASLVLSKTVGSTALDADGEPVVFGPFELSVVCSFLGEPVAADGYELDEEGTMSVVLGAGGLADDASDAVTLTGLPANASCTVTETATGSATSTAVTVTVGEGTPTLAEGTEASLLLAPDGEEPANSVAFANLFAVGSLSLEKLFDGDGAAFAWGPYEIGVLCTLGEEPDAIEVWSGTVVLGGEEELSATIDGIPAGASCAVDETDPASAGDHEVEGSPALIGSGETAEVTITNLYAVGSIEVTKLLEGDGAEAYGSGPFVFTAECLFEGQQIEVPEGSTRTVLRDELGAIPPAVFDGLPVGADCTVTESGPGGASSSSLVLTADGEPQGDPVEGGAGLELLVGEDGPVAVEAVNAFALADLFVTKELLGELGDHPQEEFSFSLACSLDVNGEERPIEIPGGAERRLSQATGWTAVYEQLPVGADCVVTETETHGAETTATTLPGDLVATEGLARAVVVPEEGTEVAYVNVWGPSWLSQTGTPLAGLLAGLAAVLLALGLGAVAAVTIRRRRAAG